VAGIIDTRGAVQNTIASSQAESVTAHHNQSSRLHPSTLLSLAVAHALQVMMYHDMVKTVQALGREA
jgi:hypothetical protein